MQRPSKHRNWALNLCRIGVLKRDLIGSTDVLVRVWPEKYTSLSNMKMGLTIGMELCNCGSCWRILGKTYTTVTTCTTLILLATLKLLWVWTADRTVGAKRAKGSLGISLIAFHLKNASFVQSFLAPMTMGLYMCLIHISEQLKLEGRWDPGSY